MRKILAGGTFNLLHPGHVLFLEKARKMGDYLVVVVASDKTVLGRKGFLLMDAKARRRVLASLKAVDKAVIGDDKDFMKVVRKERPDVIALGYDQHDAELEKRIASMGIKIVRIRSSLKGYKTERMLRNLKKCGQK